MRAPAWVEGPVAVYLGNCLEVLCEMPDESVDSLVTDPPAGISFMGKAWDHDHGGRDRWVVAFAPVFAECLRALKPGAHGLVWALPRTSHWTATALEDAGFEIRDIVHHHFGSGFPKSLDVSKAIDKAAGAERASLGTQPDRWTNKGGVLNFATDRPQAEVPIVGAPATDAARQWEGWGTALKPATEHWILVRKPLVEANVAANVLPHGTGAINIDGCRTATGDDLNGGAYSENASARWDGADNWRYKRGEAGAYAPPGGRWPANLALSHDEGCQPVGVRRVATGRYVGRHRDTAIDTGSYSGGWRKDGRDATYADPDGAEAVKAWECAPGCPVAELDRQSGASTSRQGWPRVGRNGEGWGMAATGAEYNDAGGASRFFYTAKASSAERNAGLPTGQRNTHPTVKPLGLMRWLCRLITPPGGMVLDPFAGSGSTLVAARLEGFRAIGVDQDPRYVEIARYRVACALHQPSLFPVAESLPLAPASAEEVPAQASLFEALT